MSRIILYKFKFEEENSLVYEVKFLDVADDAPKSEKYAWILQNDGIEKKLQFLKMDGNKRYFTDGSILDMDELIFAKDNTVYKLTNQSTF